MEREANVVHLVIDGDSPLNILSRQTLVELRQVLMRLTEEADAAALILTGSGSRAFSAGANLREISELTPATALEFSHLGQSVTSLLADFPAPVIAALNGLAYGGGLELAIACDFRIASSEARFAYPSSKLGILPGFGGTQRCPMLIGPSRSKELMFLGRVIDAEEALHWGLVNLVVPPEELLGEAKNWADELAARSTYAIRQAKECIGMTERADFFFEQEAFANCFRRPDVQENIRNWLESSTSAQASTPTEKA
jgi:enoyl-CoA hydratase